MATARADAWRKAVVLSNVRANRLIVTHATGSYLSFLQNWLVGMRALGIDEYVCVANDGATWDFMRRFGLERKAVHFGFEGEKLNADDLTWYDARYRTLMGVQPWRLLSIFESGSSFDLLVADVDVVWRRSPWLVLDMPSRRHCDVQAMAGGRPDGPRTTGAWDAPVRVLQPHPQANCATCLNAGFLYLRRNPRSASLLRRWVDQLGRRHEKDTNQKWLNWILSNWTSSDEGGFTEADPSRNASKRMDWRDPPTACQLNPANFTNGLVLKDQLSVHPRARCNCDAREVRGCETRARRQAVGLVAAHLNYLPSTSVKVCAAKELGLWLISNRTVERASFVGSDRGQGMTDVVRELVLSWRLTAARTQLVVDRVEVRESAVDEIILV